MDSTYLFVREGTNPVEYQAGQGMKFEDISADEDEKIIVGVPAKGDGQAFRPWFSYDNGHAGCDCPNVINGSVTYCRHIIGLFENLSKRMEKYGEMFIEARENNAMLSSFKTKSGFIPTGIDSVDELLGGGIPRGVVTLLGGPTKVGKTFFSSSLACFAAMNGFKVMYIDTEHMLRRQDNFDQIKNLMKKRWKWDGDIDGIYPMQQHNLYEVGKLFGLYIYIPKGTDRKLVPVLKKEYNDYTEIPIYKLCKSYGVDLVIFDGLTQLFKSGGVTTSQTQNLIGRGEIINLLFESFEGIAGELDTAFILTSHASRDNRYFNLYDDIIDVPVTEQNIGIWGGSSLFYNVKYFIQLENCSLATCKGRNIKHFLRRLYPFRRSTHINLEFVDDYGFVDLEGIG